MENEFLIKFGGKNHIRVETLTNFLDNYSKILYQVNKNLGYSEEDLIIEVSPPEEGSFKIRINPKYENLLLNIMGSIVAGTLSGLMILWISTTENQLYINDIEQIIKTIKKIIKKFQNKYLIFIITLNINK